MIVSTTRPISCLTLRSRSGVPICPRKYFETTMLVACCDQNFGNLDVALLEHQLAALVADDRRAQLPFDLVERIDARFGEEARERQTRATETAAFGLDARRLHAPPGTWLARARLHCLLAGTCGLVGSVIFHALLHRHAITLPPKVTSLTLSH